MTNYDPNDLSGTENLVMLDREPAPSVPTAKPKRAAKKKTAPKSTGKHSAVLSQPSQTIEEAIVVGVAPKQLDAPLKKWGDYHLQQAALKAKADTAALASSIQVRRREIFDELLSLADARGLSMAEARKVFDDALAVRRKR